MQVRPLPGWRALGALSPALTGTGPQGTKLLVDGYAVAVVFCVHSLQEDAHGHEEGEAIPDGYHSVTPHLVVRGAAKAIAFYGKAFLAEEMFRMPSPDGKDRPTRK